MHRTEADLAAALDLPRVAWYASLPSTMDVAHQLAHDGAPAGTLVIADAQTHGRGRGGRGWMSAAASGVWMTLIERPLDASGLDVLSLRVGIRAAASLERFADGSLCLKWPNDLMRGDGKVGGILIEARWREQRPEWVAIGIGINLAMPLVAGGTALGGTTRAGAGVDRWDVLAELIPAVRAAAAGRGALSEREVASFAACDWARGRRVVSPVAGTVTGISPAGAVLIETSQGAVACASGSLVLAGESP